MTLGMEADGFAVYWEIRVKKPQYLVWLGVGQGWGVRERKLAQNSKTFDSNS